MKTGETKVIAERESGNYMNVMSWSEFLVLEKLNKVQFQLDTRRNEVIDEAHNYCAENDLIDDAANIAGEVTFTSPGQQTVMDWCKQHEWDYDRIIKSLIEECSGSKQSSKKKTAKKKSSPKSKKTPKKDRSLSPEEVKMRQELYKLKLATYKNSTKKKSPKKGDSNGP